MQPLFAMGHRPPIHHPVAPRFSSWLVYWNMNKGFETLHQKPILEELCVFAYNFDDQNHLIPAMDNTQDLISTLKSGSVGQGRLLITVVNDVIGKGAARLKDPFCVHQAIVTPQARAAHIQELMDISAPFNGIDIDYERIDPQDRDNFYLFIKDLSDQLHHRGQWLSVVVEPRTETDSSPTGIDWKQIAAHADEVKVMAYLYHYAQSPPGSIAPLSWVSELAHYAQQTIPEKKLSVILHLGGLDWPASGSGHQIDYSQASALASQYQRPLMYDSETGSSYFSYNDQGMNHEVWIESAPGLKAKIKLLANLGVGHIGFWSLGAGDPAFWSSLASSHAQNASPITPP